MSNEELQEEVNQLRAKLEQTETDFEAYLLSWPSYKTSAKELEQFLEEESSKKEDEIRQLKEEFIIKEKGIKQTKQELSMLQNDYAELKVPSHHDSGSSRLNSRGISGRCENFRRTQKDVRPRSISPI